jgi:hypothetical protein
LAWLALSLALALLALGMVLVGYPPLALFALPLAALWGLGRRYQRRWLISLVLAGCCLALIALSVLGLSPYWLIAIVLALLSAWDLEYFSWRLSLAELIEGEKELVLRHLLRLGLVCLLGFLLVEVALLLELRLGFGLLLFLALLGVLALRQGLDLLGRSVE